MEILFLGTSSGIPTTTRNVSALAVRLDGSRRWYLVDCGEGTQHRILHTHLSLATLRAIFITHVHGDHCYGLPGLLASAGMLKRSEPLAIVGPAAVERFVRGVMEATELRLPYALQFMHVDNGQTKACFDDVEVYATALSHRVPSFAYSFTEKAVVRKLDVARLARDCIPEGPVRGQLQQGLDVTLPDGRTVRAADYVLPPRKPRKVIIGGDNDTPRLLAHEAAEADVLIHEATYTEALLEKVGPGPQHSSARRVAQFANEANIRNLILTHFSPRYQEGGNAGLSLPDLEAEARASYRGNLFLAHDFDVFRLDKHGMLARSSLSTAVPV
jgi:ribonuclease Z